MEYCTSLCCEITVFCAKKKASMRILFLALVLLTGLLEYVVAVSCAGFSMFGSCFCFLSFKRSVKEVSKSIELDSSGGTHVNVCCL